MLSSEDPQPAPPPPGETPSSRLRRLAATCLGVSEGGAIAAKLGLPTAALDALWAFVDGDAPQPPAGTPGLLAVTHAVMRAAGGGPDWLRAWEGVVFPLAETGSAWSRRLGPGDPGRDAFDRALAKLRPEAWGLHVRRQVAIAGERVDWACAGLLHDGRLLRLAVRVRPAPTPLSALVEDVSDDALAAAGFEVLGFRDWQLRHPGAMAQHVAAFLAERVPGFRAPFKILDPEDDAPLTRLQAAPRLLTPREESPNWALRAALRRSHPGLSGPAFQRRYRDAVLAVAEDSAEGGEQPIWA